MVMIHHCTIKQDDYLDNYKEYEYMNNKIHDDFNKKMDRAVFSNQKKEIAYKFISDLIRIEQKYGDYVKHIDEYADAKINELRIKYSLSDNKIGEIFSNERKEKTDIYIFKFGDENKEDVFDLEERLGIKDEKEESNECVIEPEYYNNIGIPEIYNETGLEESKIVSDETPLIDYIDDELIKTK